MSKIVANIPAIRSNAVAFLEYGRSAGAELTAVTKFCTSDSAIVEQLASCGIRSIADSNMRNFAGVRPGVRKTLIKTRLSDIRALSHISSSERPDRMFVSDRALLSALSDLSPDVVPEIVLIAELGDCKDGMYPDELMNAVRAYPSVPVLGVSTNFACLSGCLPTAASISALRDLAIAVQKERGLGRPFISLGGTVVWKLLTSGALDGLATEIRIGEGIFFGYDSSGGTGIPALRRDCFSFCGEIVEASEKKIELTGEQGYTALGKQRAMRGATPESGLRKRAVLDFGVLAALDSDLEPFDSGIELVGQTFDFTVVDNTESSSSYAAGDFVSFRVGYSGASRAYINPYVAREVTLASQKDN